MEIQNSHAMQSTHSIIAGSCIIRKGSNFTGLACLLLLVNSVGLGLGQLFLGQISDKKKFFFFIGIHYWKFRIPMQLKSNHLIITGSFSIYKELGREVISLA